MKLFSEHTTWTGGGTNHWYLLNDNRSTMFGYRKFGTGEVVLFRTPLPFYEKGRKLRLEHDFGDVSGKVVYVQGSKGDVYTVDFSREHPTCSCHAYKFRGDCKHIAVAEKQRG